MKPKICAQCGFAFQPFNPMQKVCGVPCGIAYAKAKKKRERAQDAEKRKALKTIPQLKKEAQHTFNAYIRYRDRERLCICCDRPYSINLSVKGGNYDAGHYRSTGSADHLRFNEDNCNGQRKDCNRFGAGRAVDYRIGLIKRIGLARVEAIEKNSDVIKWTREMLIEIRDKYRKKLKELKKHEKNNDDR